MIGSFDCIVKVHGYKGAGKTRYTQVWLINPDDLTSPPGPQTLAMRTDEEDERP